MTNAALHVARTGLDAQDVKMRVIANNLANVNTTGFKRDRANFETLAYQQVIAAGSQADSQNKLAIGLNLGSGVQLTGNTPLTMSMASSSVENGITDVTGPKISSCAIRSFGPTSAKTVGSIYQPFENSPFVRRLPPATSLALSSFFPISI